jgi:hypothetical protein
VLWCPDLTTCRYGMCNNPVQVLAEPGPNSRQTDQVSWYGDYPFPGANQP